MKYKNHERNHVILLGREKALEDFLNSTVIIDGQMQKHKIKNGISSNSEDALTWSCFDILRNLSHYKKVYALNEILEDAFEGAMPFSFNGEQNIKISIGEKYETVNLSKKERTEVDASIETNDKIIFFEAKLYSLVSFPDESHKYNQIATKLRVGLDYANKKQKKFYFIFLDIAPLEKLYQRRPKKEAEEASHNFEDKWKSAWWFNYYKKGHRGSLKPLKEVLGNITFSQSIEDVAANMGWLTWANLFKTILRAVVQNNS